ncbi:hypothetical protein PybrP1_009345 [[Pythium] brassicae (nom. inval.)]|nr:hypothetical protein PybrP1_009345 [[Pythium] brassicae (nom. inval.)]
MAAPLVRRLLLARARMAPPAVRAASSFASPTTSAAAAASVHPALLSMAFERVSIASLVRAQPLVFETRLELPIAELPALHQIGDIECPTESLNEPLQAIKRTYQPSVLRRKRKHGFRSRRLTVSGRKMLTRRFVKGRWRMSL